MILKQLGREGIYLPPIGLGTLWYKGSLLKEAVTLGMVLVDTNETYGYGKVEQHLGEELKTIPRSKVFLATKACRTHLSYNSILRAAERSLKRLQIDYIDLYSVQPNKKYPLVETLGAMEDLVDQGKIRYIGVSNYSVNLLKQAQILMNKHHIVSNQVRYNPLDRGVEETMIPYCELTGVTLMGYSPLGQNYKYLIEQATWDSISLPKERTPAQLILAWVIRHSNVMTVIKTNSLEHLRQNWLVTQEVFENTELQIIDRLYPIKERADYDIRFSSRWQRILGNGYRP